MLAGVFSGARSCRCRGPWLMQPCFENNGLARQNKNGEGKGRQGISRVLVKASAGGLCQHCPSLALLAGGNFSFLPACSIRFMPS